MQSKHNLLRSCFSLSLSLPSPLSLLFVLLSWNIRVWIPFLHACGNRVPAERVMHAHAYSWKTYSFDHRGDQRWTGIVCGTASVVWQFAAGRLAAAPPKRLFLSSVLALRTSFDRLYARCCRNPLFLSPLPHFVWTPLSLSLVLTHPANSSFVSVRLIKCAHSGIVSFLFANPLPPFSKENGRFIFFVINFSIDKRIHNSPITMHFWVTWKWHGISFELL